jgi:hypothetical protein
MRSGKSFLALMALALGLGAYIYFVEMKREPASDAAAKKDKVFALQPGAIEELEIHAASGERTTVVKKGSDWAITAPEPLDADATETASVATTIEGLEIQRVIDEAPASLADFGLDPARITVGFREAGQTTRRTLRLGQKTPTGGDVYAQVEGQPRVFLISGYLEDSLNKTPFNLREKSVLKFTRDGVDSLTLEAAGAAPLAFARGQSEWRFTKPTAAKADFSAVDGIVGGVFQARMKSVVPATVDARGALAAADMKKFGFDKPQATAVLGSGSTRATLVLGGAADDTSVYARDLSRPIVFTVEKSLVDTFTRKADDLRKKDVFEFRSFTALGLDLTLGGQSVTFGKEKPAKADQSTAVDEWKIQKPAAKDVDQTKVTDLLTTISNLRAESFTDKPSPTGETLVVTARFGDTGSPSTETVTLRKSGAAVHAIVPGEPGAAVVSTADFDKAVSLFKELAGIK